MTTVPLPPLELYGARHEKELVNIRIDAGRIAELSVSHSGASVSPHAIDLRGYMLLPGLVNAHDHLGFALFPRLGNPPYRNYIDWGEDIHRQFPETIAKHKAISKEVRAWWGGIRNLLCGVTTVSHHDKLWPVLQENAFPIKVVQTNSWAHSLALGGDLSAASRAMSSDGVFILHAGEGIDDLARDELWQLDRMGLLNATTVLVHGLAIDAAGFAVVRERKAALITCPSSNHFLFDRIPDWLFEGPSGIALGSDSPLTAKGDLLDEVQFAIGHCGITPQDAYRMVTESPASILHLENGAGRIIVHGPGDLIAVQDSEQEAPATLSHLSHQEIELVVVNGSVQLASEAMMERLPDAVKRGMERLWVEGTIRWLRAPINELLRKTEAVLGEGQVRLGGKLVRHPA